MKNKIIGIFVVVLFIGISIIPSIFGFNLDDQLDQEQTKENWGSIVCGRFGWAQSFVPLLNTLTRVELLLCRFGDITTPIKVAIRSEKEGNDLTSIFIPYNQIPITETTWIEFNFNNISVTPGETYWIYCSTSGGDNVSNYYSWGNSKVDVYNKGSAWLYVVQTKYWTERLYDFCFKTYGCDGSIEPFNPPEWVNILMDITESRETWDGEYWCVTIPFGTSYLPKAESYLPTIPLGWPFKGDGGFSGEFNYQIKVKIHPYDPSKNSYGTGTIWDKWITKVPLLPGDWITLKSKSYFRADNTWNEGDVRFDSEFNVKLFEIHHNFVIVVIPITVHFEVNVAGGATTGVNSPQLWIVNNGEYSNVYYNDGYYGFRLLGKIGVGFNLGWYIRASLGFYGEAWLKWWLLNTPRITVTGEIGVYGEIFIWEGRWCLLGPWDWSWQPGSIDMSEEYIKNMLEKYSQESVSISNSDWQLIPRIYGEPEWQNNDKGILIKEVFPFAGPNIDSMDGNKIMVWGYDDQSKEQMNGLEIQYSVWNGDSWSSPDFITLDNYLEMYPSVAYLENGDAICVFNVLPVENVADFNDFVENVEVGYSYWNHETDEWSSMNIIEITDEYMDTQPVIASDGNEAVVVWTCDNDKDMFTIDDIVAYASFWDGNEWQNTRKIMEGNIVSNPLSIAYKDGEASIVYAVDNDGNLSTVEDYDIFMKTFSSTEDISTILITDDDLSDALPSIAHLGNNLALTWIKENGNLTELYYHEMGTGNNIKVIDGNISHPTLLSGGSDGSQPVIGWKDYDLEKLMVTSLDYGGWITNTVYNSTRFVDQFYWEYTDSMPFATFIEKDNITSKTNCSLIHRTFNVAPEKPLKPSGETSGKRGEEYTYTSSSTDSESDKIYYMWDWGDGNFSDWLGPYNSDETVETLHNWTRDGTYAIKVLAKDDQGDESEWSDLLVVSMPKNKAIQPFILFLERLMERFPILEQILQLPYDKLADL